MSELDDKLRALEERHVLESEDEWGLKKRVWGRALEILLPKKLDALIENKGAYHWIRTESGVATSWRVLDRPYEDLDRYYSMMQDRETLISFRDDGYSYNYPVESFQSYNIHQLDEQIDRYALADLYDSVVSIGPWTDDFNYDLYAPAQAHLWDSSLHQERRQYLMGRLGISNY